MRSRSLIGWLILLAALVLASGASGLVSARATERDVGREPILLRLKYATFDPLRGEPAVDAALRTDAYPGSGEGAYIVQFKGPIQGAWKEQVSALGARVMDYLPDYAFLVWMDSAVRDRVAALDIVRWVGLYQPAYKLSPNLDRAEPLYVVVLFEGADLATVEARLPELNTPTREVPDEQFVLLLPEGGVDQVAAWPEVLWIENSRVPQVSNNVATGIMGAPEAWASLYTGDGQIVTVADTGIDTGIDDVDMHDDFDGRFLQIQSYPVHDSWAGCAANVYADDGAADVDSGHGTHVLGSVLGDGGASGGTIKGTAWEATPTFQAIEQETTWTLFCGGGTEYALTGLPADGDYYSLFQDAYNWDSRIHSNSWGSRYDGEYTAASRSVDLFVWDHPEMLILFSAGNWGTDIYEPPDGYDGYVNEDSLDSPGTAKNALTVGASDNERSYGGYQMTWGALDLLAPDNAWPKDPTKSDWVSDNRAHLAAFSSRGPTDDGRIKPDVVAPGTNIASARSSATSATGWGLYAADPADYMYLGGTSMATPLTAGAAALVREYYAEAFDHTAPSAALIKATLINSAVDITGYGNSSEEAGQPIPNNHEGWGRVDVGAATSGERQFVDGDSVGTGGSQSYAYGVTSSDTPLKVTLVWSDYPAPEAADPALQNDLDLVVTAPDGITTYLGNDFDRINGWTLPGGTVDDVDRVNNVESVYIANPPTGSWTVRVTGFNVAEPGGNPQQPFALVVTGDFGLLPDRPVAAFSGDPRSGEAPLEVTFTDESTGGEPTSWLWDFGDGETSAVQNPGYKYFDPGDYTVSLRVSNAGGSDTEIKTDYIHVAPPPPVADFTGSPLSGAAPLRVDFVDLSLGVIDGWEWSFGDGDTSTLPEPSHTYRAEGSYTVTLTVTNSSGSDTLIRPNYIEVTAPVGQVFLPLVSRSYLSPDPIADGGFEEGPWAEWIEYSTHNLQLVMPEDSPDVSIPAHGGTWLAWLGGYEDEEAYVEQMVLFPSDRAYLHFWHWVSSSNLDCNTAQEAEVLVDGTTVRTYALCSANNTLHGWVEQVVDLRAYAGRWVPLQLYATTTVDASSWYIDDVSLQATGVVADADMSVVLDPAILSARKAAPAPDTPLP